MAQHFNREAVVIIWNYGGPGHPGHAAMKIRGVPGAPEGKYISFWPGSGAGLSNALKRQGGILETNYWSDKYDEMGEDTRERLEQGIYQPNHLQQSKNFTRTNDEGVEETVAYWLQKPHHKIYLPGMGATGTKAGLNLKAIYEWFEIFSNSPQLKYKFASKTINCSGVVLMALLKGGGSAFATKPSAKLFIDPNQVRIFAEQIGVTLTDLNANATEIEKLAAFTNAPKYTQDLSMDLISYQDWKTKTDLGKFTGRSHVAKIDDALKQYHQGKLTLQKVELLGKLLKAVRKHTVDHHSSRRGGPVLELGKQALSVLKFNLDNYNLARPDWLGD